jgi:hypothetical protein
MQTCSVLVALGGSNDNIVLKEGVTVPEVVVLMAGHGRHSITRVPNTLQKTEGEVSAKAECDRLSRCYGEEAVTLAFGANRFNVSLPSTFDAIDFNEVDLYGGIASPASKEITAEEPAPEEEPAPAKKPSKKSITPFDA